MIQKFTFDVMSDDGRFICTMRMPLGLGSIIDYEGDKPVISMAAVAQPEKMAYRVLKDDTRIIK